MTSIEIVLTDPGWCLERQVKVLEVGLADFDVTVTDELQGGADITYFAPWFDAQAVEGSASVAFFTHLNAGQQAQVAEMIDAVDYIAAQCENSKRIAVELGADPERVTVIHPGVSDAFAPQKIRIGTAGRPYLNGRKREWLFLELAWRMDLSPFEVVLVGENWKQVAVGLGICGIDVQCIQVDDYEAMPKILRSLDYYISTGFAEGGPYGVHEALACGVPVVTYPTGYAAALAGVVETYETIGDLQAILERVSAEKVGRVEAVADWTWEGFVEGHRALFQRITGGEQLS